MTFRKLFLLVGDVFFLYLSLVLMLLIRFRSSFSYSVWLDHLYPFSVVFLVWIVIFYIWDMYSLSFERQRENFVNAMIMCLLVAMAMFYVASGTKIAPKTNLLVTFGVYTVFFFSWRLVCSKIFLRIGSFIRVAVVGIDKYTIEIINKINSNIESGYKVYYCIDLASRNNTNTVIPQDIEVIDDLNSIYNLVNNRNVDLVIVSNEQYSKRFEMLYKLITSRVSVYHITSFWEEYNESIPIEVTDDLWFLENIREDKKRLFEIAKRGMDLALVAIIIPMLLVLSMFIIIAIKLSSKGPVLINQKRVGKNNSLFVMYKFRTMIENAEQYGPQWTSENDQRITKFGKILRLTRLDEIPQIYNIITGTMSFVGPRPERPEFVKSLSTQIPHYNFRHFAKPGLTGWAQIHIPYASSVSDSAKKLEYDLYYIKNRSVLLDVKIILRTVTVILKRKGR